MSIFDIGTLHPALVHIPIGALFTYSIMEVSTLVFPKLKEKLEIGKYFVLFLGVFGGLVARQSGEELEHITKNIKLMEIHALFATVTIGLYAIILAFITFNLLSKSPKIKKAAKGNKHTNLLWEQSVWATEIVLKQPAVSFLALLGLVLLTITGALGGALTHGPEKDFMTFFVYSLFFR